MKKATLAAAAALTLALAGNAVADHAAPIPQGGPKLVKTYLKLHKAAPVPGRNVVLHGRSQDGKLVWSVVRSEANRMWLDLHPRVKREHERKRIYSAITEKKPHWPVNKRIVYAWWMANGKSEVEFNCMGTIVDRYENASWETNRSYGGYNNIHIAYGIPQANPGTKMSSHGSDWATNPITQFLWMRDYVDRYGGPCPALAYRQGHNYY